jgi:release factor glutamine methyltransferase
VNQRKTVSTALAGAVRLGVERLDAQLLLAQLLKQPRSWLFSHGDEALDPALCLAFDKLCARLADGEPLAYLFGTQDFHGLELQVGPAVLVPRPDTAILVDWALDLLRGALATSRSPRVVDLGTGSGAVALAIKHSHPAAQLTAVDASAAALAMAEANSRRLQLPLRTVHSDWWRNLAGQRFELIVANPPYIRGNDPHLADLRHEPRLALTPEGDGLAAYRSILRDLAHHLAPGGWVLFEHGWDQGPSVRALLDEAGLAQVSTRLDLAQRERCSGACRPA